MIPGMIYYKNGIITYNIKQEDDIRIYINIYYHLQWFRFKVIKMVFTDENLVDLIKAAKITIDGLNSQYKL